MIRQQGLPRKIVMLFVLMFCMVTTHAVPNNLTPQHEPFDNSFYVCYAKCCNDYTVITPFAAYRKRHYQGCMISRKPCSAHRLKHKECVRTVRRVCETDKNGKKLPAKNIVSVHCAYPSLQLFSWFTTYPQALNAYYRCAYAKGLNDG